MVGSGLITKAVGGTLNLAKKGINRGITSLQGISKLGQKAAVSAGGLGTTIGAVKLVTPSKKPNMPGSGVRMNNSYDLEMSDISKTIMERGLTHSGQGMKVRGDVGSKPSTGDTPSTPSTGDTPSKPIKKPKPISVNSSYDPLSNKEILGISEKILKKNFNLGEEGYDIARDEGRVKPSKDKKDATTMPPSKEMEKTRKKYKGPSALEIVKKKYKGQIMDVDKKKKDKK